MFQFAIIVIVVLILIADTIQNSWTKSSLRRLIIIRDKSSLQDFIWFILSMIGLSKYIIFIVTFTFVYFFSKLVYYSPPTCHWNFFIQFIFVAFTNEFLFYWTHRMMHRWFWFAHKLHHSATSFNGITVFRTHPFEVALSSPILSLPAILVGVSPKIMAVWTIVRLCHDLLIHTEIKFIPLWISEWIIVDGKQHSQHHSNNPSDYNCKFATVPIFDRIFGTWKELPDNIIIGL